MPDKKPNRGDKKLAPKKKGKKAPTVKEDKPTGSRKSNKREKQIQARRYLGDKLVIPAKYHGVGKGKFMAGMVDGKLVEKDGMPLKFREIGKLKVAG